MRWLVRFVRRCGSGWDWRSLRRRFGHRIGHKVPFMGTRLRKWWSAVVDHLAGPGPGDPQVSPGDTLVTRVVGVVLFVVMAVPIYVLVGMPGKESLPAEIRSMLSWLWLVGLVGWALIIIWVAVWLVGRAIEWAGYRFARG